MNLSFVGAFLYFACGGAVLLLGLLVLREAPGDRLRRTAAGMMFFGGLGPGVGLYALAVPVPELVSLSLPPPVRLVILTAALLFGTGAIAFAVIRTSFLDVGTVVRRAFLLSGAAGALVLVVFFLARWFDGLLEAQLGFRVPLFQGLSAALAILFFHPILGRIEAGIDRVLAGERVSHRRMLRELGRTMGAIIDLDPLSEKIVRTLREALDPVAAGDLADEAPGPDERRAAREALGRWDARIVVPIHLPDEGGCHGFIALGDVSGKGVPAALLNCPCSTPPFTCRCPATRARRS